MLTEINIIKYIIINLTERNVRLQLNFTENKSRESLIRKL